LVNDGGNGGLTAWLPLPILAAVGRVFPASEMGTEADAQGRARVEKALQRLQGLSAESPSHGKQSPSSVSSSRNQWHQDHYCGFFDFEELDDIDEVNSKEQAKSTSSTASAPPKRKWESAPAVDLQVVSGFTGQKLCLVKQVSRAWRVDELKAQIEKVEGTTRRRQQLLFDGQIPKDSDILGELFTNSSRLQEISMVRVEPQWATLIDAIAAGEVRLQDLDDAARNDRELVLTAIRATQGRALAYASPQLQTDRAVVLEAVRRNGLTLRHASSLIRRDRDVVMAAVREWAQALEFADKDLRTDYQLVMIAVRRDPRTVHVLKEELLRDRSLAEDVASDCPRVWQELPEELRGSRDFTLAVTRNNGEALLHAEEWQTDPEIALTAVQTAPHVLRDIDSSLMVESTFVLAAIDVNPKVYACLPMGQRNDKEFALVACKRDPNMAKFVPPDLQPLIWRETHREAAEQAGVPEEYLDNPDQPVWWTVGVKPKDLKTTK